MALTVPRRPRGAMTKSPGLGVRRGGLSQLRRLLTRGPCTRSCPGLRAHVGSTGWPPALRLLVSGFQSSGAERGAGSMRGSDPASLSSRVPPAPRPHLH